MTTADIQRLIYERSGLLGVSGVSGDMRTQLASDDPAATHALDLFVLALNLPPSGR
jgi:acetate kinase